MRVYLNGNYNQTIPLDALSTNFSISAMVGEGTHVIKLVGYDIRQQYNPEVEFNVTYKPSESKPSVPELPDNQSVSGVTTSQAASTGRMSFGQVFENTAGWLAKLPPIEAISDVVYDGLVALDIMNPESSNPFQHLKRLALITAGLLLVFFASFLSNILSLAVSRLIKAPVSSRLAIYFTTHGRLIVSLIGVLIVLIGLFVSL